MALDLNALQVFAQVPGSTAGTYRAMASYSTDDLVGAVEGAGYFNNAAAMLPKGSQIFVGGDIDGTPFQKAYVVSANDGSTVTISPAATATYNSQYALVVEIPDISTANERHVVVPIAGTIVAVYSALGGALTGDDAVLTIKAPDGTVGTITVAHSGSAEADVDSLTSGLNNTTVDAGETIEVETGGQSTGTEPVVVTILVAPS